MTELYLYFFGSGIGPFNIPLNNGHHYTAALHIYTLGAMLSLKIESGVGLLLKDRLAHKMVQYCVAQ
jgi:hypothetical protein